MSAGVTASRFELRMEPLHEPRAAGHKLRRALRRVRGALVRLARQLQPTPRRQRLESCSPCRGPATPQRCRQVLGRTPAKLYSPFGIETPRYPDNLNDSIYYPDTPEHGVSPVRKHFKSKSHVWRLINTRPRSLFQ